MVRFKHVQCLLVRALNDESGASSFVGAVMDVTAAKEATTSFSTPETPLEKAFEEINNLKRPALSKENIALREEIETRQSMFR